MKVLICGGRGFIDIKFLYKELDKLNEQYHFTRIIHGDYHGADILAKQWARSRDIKDWPFPADWSRLGRSAGPIRNQKMLDEGKPDLVVAFDGGAGTADMVHKARQANVEVIEVKRD